MTWEAQLSTYISTLYEQKKAGETRAISAAVLEMSRNFSELRRFRKNDYFSEARARSAYWSYFAPRNIGRLSFLLDQLESEGHLDEIPQKPYVVDLGSGPLVGVAAFALRFAQSDARFLAVDQSRQILSEGRAYFSQFFPREKMPVQIVSGNLKGSIKKWGSRTPADLVIVANVLNEFGAPKRSMSARINFVEQVQSFVKPGGYLLLVEPAQRVASQGLSLLRDAWRGGKKMSLKAPCMGLHQCPMGMHKSSWCHTSFNWEQPEYLTTLMGHIGFEPNPVSLSYLLWQKKKRPRFSSGLRLVSQPLKRTSQGAIVLGCNDKNKIIELTHNRLPKLENGIYRGRCVQKKKNSNLVLGTEN